MRIPPALRYLGCEPKPIIRVIVAGSRVHIPEYHFDRLVRQLIAGIETDDIRVLFVSGMANEGADKQIVEWCDLNSYDYEPYPANWDEFGKRAGFIRNGEMAKVGDILLAFWTQQSKGTANMIEQMQHLGKPTITIHY